ncbi:MAG TPA: tripartite tricarboxylate transporter substrate binding protein [Burkholderiaceae bacterium]|jgi:tripartite-type tricarboxylate transporter receptor subunit TctC|nr:tripartite tricarboxylate transporter substrate binding protein [Burkholderiaceae bacterium]
MTFLPRMLIAAATALMIPASAVAQPYPNKPVRIVVPWPAGGLVDIVARSIAPKLSSALGQPVVVENKPGAGGAIGADTVAKAAPDGHTLALTTSALTMNTALGTKTPFNLDDLQPVAIAAYAPNILVVHPSLPVNSVKELVELARSKPGQLTYASAGTGSPAHFSGELFKSMMGLFIVHVPYKGAPPAMVDQIAGRIDFHFANAAVALPQIEAGRVRALAVTSAKRSAFLPDLPTMSEAGVAQFEADQWLGILAPSGTPREIVDRLSAEINKALAMPDVQAALTKSGMSVADRSTPESFRKDIERELAKWTQLVKKANITID